MNPGNGSAKTRPLVGVAAALVLIVSFFLPWLTWSGLASYSLVDIVSKSAGGGWLTIMLLVGGAILAVVGSGAKAAGATVSRTPAALWVVGFGSALGGFALYLIDLSNYTNTTTYYGYSYSTGLGAGFGVWLGIAATVVGLVVGLIELVAPPAAWSPVQAPVQTIPTWQNPVAAQSYSPSAGNAAPSMAGRLTYIEAGHPKAVVVNPGEQVMIGRDPGARVHLSDPKVSRQHALVTWSGGQWVVRDLGATNPTRVIGASGVAQPLAGEMRIASGQMLVGDVLITLFPAGA
jgi:hypothetical protein